MDTQNVHDTTIQRLLNKYSDLKKKWVVGSNGFQ
jgi:hypothetical protein